MKEIPEPNNTDPEKPNSDNLINATDLSINGLSKLTKNINHITNDTQPDSLNQPEVDKPLSLNNTEVSPGARNVLKKLHQSGYEAYLVGGFVRDAVLGKQPKDEDITTNALPSEVTELFEKSGHTVIPSGIEFGTVTVLDNEDTLDAYEITTYRSDASSTDQRHPDGVSFVSSLKEDMARRDFTMNALALDLADDGNEANIIDYYGGVEDIKQGIIRSVGNPEDRISEDALRMMRAVRFSAQKEMSIDPSLAQAIKSHAPEIQKVSGERLGSEITKILLSKQPSKGLHTMYELGLMQEIVPEAATMYETEQNNPNHIFNVGEHTEAVVDNTPIDLEIRLAAWLHDVAKPITKTTDKKGVDHFYGHPASSAEMAQGILRKLRFKAKTISRVCNLIELHDTEIQPTEEKICRFIEKHPNFEPNQFEQLVELRRADILGQNPEVAAEKLSTLDQINILYQEIVSSRPTKIKDLAMNGRDVMAVTTTRRGEEVILRGKAIGVALEKMLSFALRHPEKNNKEDLTDFLKANLKSIYNSTAHQ